jgi:hypothetical protein
MNMILGCALATPHGSGYLILAVLRPMALFVALAKQLLYVVSSPKIEYHQRERRYDHASCFSIRLGRVLTDNTGCNVRRN